MYSTLQTITAFNYTAQTVAEGEKLYEPYAATIDMTPLGYYEERMTAGLVLVGWTNQSGQVWDFEKNTVESDMSMYPIWQDGEGNRYYTVIYRISESEIYCINSLREGSRGYDPEGDEPQEGDAYAFREPSRAGYDLIGWSKENQWDTPWGDAETVDGFEILDAIWQAAGEE